MAEARRSTELRQVEPPTRRSTSSRRAASRSSPRVASPNRSGSRAAPSFATSPRSRRCSTPSSVGSRRCSRRRTRCRASAAGAPGALHRSAHRGRGQSSRDSTFVFVRSGFLLALPEGGLARLAACRQKTREFIRAAVQEGQEAGELRSDLDAGTLATVVMGTMQMLALATATARQHRDEARTVRARDC